MFLFFAGHNISFDICKEISIIIFVKIGIDDFAHQIYQCTQIYIERGNTI